VPKVTAAERSAVERHVVRPGRRLSSGSFEETSTNSNSKVDCQGIQDKADSGKFSHTWIYPQGFGNDSFIFHRIQRASGVYNSTVLLQQIHRA
jgi:hypothetical protein